MSLAVLANHMASKGRNGDSMLVHMSPEEVRGLHALALTHGGQMTINPETGLPEAFSLKSLLKSILPAVAGFALGPAGFGIVSSALGAGALVGGATALATGSLQKGIMAGLGAYGGANLGEALVGGSSAGASAAAAEAAKNASNELAFTNAMAESVGSGAVTGEAANKFVQDAAAKAYSDFAAKPMLEQATGSFTSLKNAPGGMFGGLGALAKPALMAASPVIADAMVPTTTPMPGTGGYQYQPRIRPMAFNQYGQTLEQLPMFSATSATQPGGMAGGGIVALAAGGTPKGAMSPEEFKKMIYAGDVDASEATRRGLSYLMQTPGFNPTKAAEYWNQALGTKFNEGDYFRAMKEHGFDPYYYEKQFNTAPGPVTGGTVTPGTSTQVGGGQPIVVSPIKAETRTVAPGPVTGGTVTPGRMEQVGGGQPITVSPVKGETIAGYKGEDRTYGGGITLPKYAPPALGTPGTVTRGTQTLKDIRDEYTRSGGTTEMPTLKDFKPSVTGGSKAAYDYLMGQGDYPLNPVIPGGGPVMKPYAESVGMVPQGFFGRQGTVDNTGNFVPATPPSTGTGGFTPPGSGVVTGSATTQWRNVKTGETFIAPSTGWSPPSADWVIDNSQYTDTAPAGVGTGGASGPGPGNDGFGEGVGEAKNGGLMSIAAAGAAQGGGVHRYNLGGYSDGGRLLRGPGDGVSDSIPATIGGKQPARLADGEFVVPARIVSEIGNGSTEAGARKLYAMMDRVQRARAKTTGKGRVAKNTRAEKYLPA